jgi:nitroimidazol reductase NimA-like FMN-containing flavoprotein (pyridoxamine 5'-phosphate oxidase superfamily)
MSSFSMRRGDRVMSADDALQVIERGYSCRLATVGADGAPYCTPFLYVWMDGKLYVHSATARGHFRTNVDRDPRVCFQLDEQEGVFDYGRFECDSGLAFRSVVVFGTIRVVTEPAVKQAFCEALLRKYGKPDLNRPKNFFPRLDLIAVFEIAVERLTGKETAMPPIAEQWPAKDRTKTPHVVAPE